MIFGRRWTHTTIWSFKWCQWLRTKGDSFWTPNVSLGRCSLYDTSWKGAWMEMQKPSFLFICFDANRWHVYLIEAKNWVKKFHKALSLFLNPKCVENQHTTGECDQITKFLIKRFACLDLGSQRRRVTNGLV